MDKERIRNIQKPLIGWYQSNKRILPWREEKDPYAIWISEIMLQQTRIEAVKIYYERFRRELPHIEDLAKIEEERLLKLWEGLGYYNRARNLKKAAQLIQEEYSGNMPQSYEELIKLPGIGEYTAGAIASIAFNQKVPAVDGNVLRVISRIVGSKKDILLPQTKKEVTEMLRKNMPEEAGDFNEGLMELGETICIPNGEPLCERCPIATFCIAKRDKITSEIPVRIKKVNRRVEEKTVFLFTCQDEIAIIKRKNKGLLASMYEFPNVEGKCETQELSNYIRQWNLKEKQISKLGEAKHIFSHIEWYMIGYQIEVEEKNDEFIWENKDNIFSHYAIPGAFDFYKKQLGNIFHCK